MIGTWTLAVYLTYGTFTKTFDNETTCARELESVVQQEEFNGELELITCTKED